MSDLFLGIDLGGTKVLSAVIDADGNVLGRGKKKTGSGRDGEEIFSRLIESAEKAIEDAEIDRGQIKAIGVGSPGPLDPRTGIVIFTPNLGFRDFPLRDRVAEALGAPTFVNNDVSIGTFGEWQMGAGRGVRDLIGMFVGTGIGGGLILDGKLYDGFNRVAGEIGHMPMAEGGPKCGCGNRGCLEAFASRSAISNALIKALEAGEPSALRGEFKGDPPAIRSKALARAYAAGDALTVKTLDQAAKTIGKAVGSLANILCPEMFVLGGGFIEALGADYVAKIDRAAREWAFEINMRDVKIVPASLGDDSAIQGAASYARICVAER
ncbi:MAG: Glucokinase [candidate division BRC1 bacterium ADurb.BinA364]|nr:MAG: Glucokinase [candidate division BRC1 bacterium ADurb.BinA364]